MKKILIISYQFPPKSGPGIHRSKNLVKYLREYGYEPIVLTIKEENIIKNGDIIDYGLLKDLPSDIKIIRTNSFDFASLSKFLMKIKLYRLFWFFLYPFFWEWSSMWPFFIYRKASKIVMDNDIKIIYTSSSPFSSMYLGWFLKIKHNIPWVADLRDPFTDAYAWQFPSKAHWKLAKLWEKWIFKKPDHLIVTAEELKKWYILKGIINEDRISVINNGF